MDWKSVKEFWDRRAKKYARAFDSDVYEKTLKILNRIESKGVVFTSSRILEIGSGTGIYTLPLAKRAKEVVAVDCSEEMIKILNEELKKHEIDNVYSIQAFWHEIDIEKYRFYKDFDIVFAAMTPAVKTKDDILKMEDCSRDWLIYIGWGRKRDNDLKKEIFSLHGIEFKVPGGVLMICKILQELGRKFQYEFFENSWQWRGSLEEAYEDVSAFLELHGVKPDKNRIIPVLEKYSKDGIVTHTTYAEQGFIVWQTL
ncbi:MAG: class I SAM-dependent methyltransferase [Thermodesulfovibrio sp.]|nr:class I SAM-dependent methyltransferase [Thermodesulfovibrio sp.]